MNEIGVVHVVRAKNGVVPFRDFLLSYRKNRGGADHDLVIVFKGFRGEASLADFRHLLCEIPHRSLRLWDWGFDIRAYFAAAGEFGYAYYCFLNSFSILLDECWLAKLFHGISRPGVGLVGATGSWESSYTSNLGVPEPSSSLDRWRRRRWLSKLAGQFDPYPNWHVRTNGFMISREHMGRIRSGAIRSKMDAHRFESGKNGLTRQIMRMGLQVLVAGKDGRCYPPEEWARSRTFRSEEQENLLIADNQTNLYAQANVETRRRLAAYAWGTQTAPDLSLP